MQHAFAVGYKSRRTYIFNLFCTVGTEKKLKIIFNSIIIILKQIQQISSEMIIGTFE